MFLLLRFYWALLPLRDHILPFPPFLDESLLLLYLFRLRPMGLADSISYSFADRVRECSIFGILRLVRSITVLERLIRGEKTTIDEV